MTIPAGDTTAGFTVVTAPSPGTRLVFVLALLGDGSSDVVPSAGHIIVPTAQTGLIEITTATMSKTGTLTVTAVSENPAAVLTSEFNGQPVPGESSRREVPWAAGAAAGDVGDRGRDQPVRRLPPASARVGFRGKATAAPVSGGSMA